MTVDRKSRPMQNRGKTSTSKAIDSKKSPKSAEEALAVSEAELRALLASMQDVVLVIDRDGVYLKIAPTNPDLLTKPPQELLGKNLRDVFSPDQANIFSDCLPLSCRHQEY